MQGSRLHPNIFRNKPRAILDGRFPFTADLQVGDKGQLKSILEVQSERLQMDEDGTERKRTTLLFIKAEPIEIKQARIDA